MKNTRIIILSLAMTAFVALLIWAYTLFGTGTIEVYGDEYVSKYFQRDQIMEVDIQIDAADWEQMLASAAEEKFVTATVVINGDAYQSVRIRPKGNSSLRSVASSTSDRYSFKINFNDIIKTQTMAGLTQLNLNNGFSDPSYMREYLSYQIFEEMGVAVPAFSYAAVNVNGEYFGLYLAVESILEPYLERNFGDITGDLYKSTGNTLKYNGSDPADYSGLEVKSTYKNADWTRLIAMLDVLNNGGDIEEYLDIDAALKYIAVNAALVNFDSYLGNFGHNYYLYEQNGVYTILPWDMNMSFGGFGGSSSHLYIDEPVQGSVADRPLVARLLADEDYLQTYHGYLEQIADQYLSGSYLKTETDRLRQLIGEYVQTDPTAFYTYEQFEQGISGVTTDNSAADNTADNAADKEIPEAPAEDQAGNNEGRRSGLQQGGGGFGGNTPAILELAAQVSDTIKKQLSGELPSTNDGQGMSSGQGQPGGGMPPDENTPGQPDGQRPGGNQDRQNRENPGEWPGGNQDRQDRENPDEWPGGNADDRVRGNPGEPPDGWGPADTNAPGQPDWQQPDGNPQMPQDMDWQDRENPREWPGGNINASSQANLGEPSNGIINAKGQANFGESPDASPQLPQDLDWQKIEELRQEITQAGELTDELRQKAEELGIPEEMMEMLTRSRDQERPGGMKPPGDGDGNRPPDMKNRQSEKTSSFNLLAISGGLIAAGIIAALLFKRRRYHKA